MGLPTCTELTKPRHKSEYCQWSKEEEDKLVRLATGGHTDKEIQEELGGTRGLASIRMRRNHMGLSAHRRQRQLLLSEKEKA